MGEHAIGIGGLSVIGCNPLKNSRTREDTRASLWEVNERTSLPVLPVRDWRPISREANSVEPNASVYLQTDIQKNLKSYRRGFYDRHY